MGNTGLLPVGKATTTCDQGHMCNMEGPPRLLAPASVGSVGNCMGSEEERSCSRFNGDQLAQNDVAFGRENMDLLKDGDEFVDRQAHGIAKDHNIYGIYKIFDQLTQSAAVNDCNTFGDKCLYEFGDRVAHGIAKTRIYMDVQDGGDLLAQKGVNDQNMYDNVINGYGDRSALNTEATDRIYLDNDIFNDDIIAAKDTYGKYGIGNDISIWDVNMVQQHITSPRERISVDADNADAFVAIGVQGNNVSPPPGFNNVNQWNDLNDGDRLDGANATHQNEDFVRVPLASLHRARRPIDTIDDQYRQALSANPHVGQGDYEPRIVPVGNDLAQDVAADIQRRNRNIVVDAARVSREMKQAIVRAHEYLDENSKIPQELIDAMSLHLETSIVWLVEETDQQDTVLQHHVNVKTHLENEIEHLAEQNQQLLNQLALKRQGSSGLSSAQLLQFQLMGISGVDDLISKYRLLQGQLKNQPLSLSRSSSKLSLDSTQVSHRAGLVSVPREKGESMLSSMGKGDKASKNKVEVIREVATAAKAPQYPQLEKFKGKTRVELERFFRYFEPYAASMSLSDSDKALFVGFYLPTLQPQHDSLMQRKACYEQVKRELLNALGSDSSVTTYSLRTALDKIVKPADKTYRELLEKVEHKVAEAYGADQGQREQELKKILLRLTQEDANTSYNSTILPHTSSDYYRLKELVLGTEDANKLRKQNADAKKSLDRNSSFSPKFNSREPRYGTPPKAWSPKRNGDASDTISQKHFAQGNTPPRSSYVPPVNQRQDNRSYLKCYDCQGTDHLAKNCSLRREANVIEQNHERYPEIFDELGKLPYSPDDDEKASIYPVGGIVPINAVRNSSNSVKMFGEKTLLETRLDGVKVTSMLDSGACVSVINHETLKKILRNKARSGKITREQEHLYKDNGLVGANGSKLNVVDCVRIPITWGEYPPSPAIFFVVAGLQQEVLIGTNVLNVNSTWMNALQHALKIMVEPASLPKHSFASVASGDESAKTKKCLQSINGIGCESTKVLTTSSKATRGDAGTESCMKKFAGNKLNEIYTLLYRALFCIRESSIGTVLTRDENKSRNFKYQNRDASSYGAIPNKNHKENRKFFKRANFVQSSQSSKRSSPFHQNCNRDTKAIRGLQLFQSSRDPKSTRDAQSSHDPQSTRRQKNARYGKKNQNYWGQ